MEEMIMYTGEVLVNTNNEMLVNAGFAFVGVLYFVLMGAALLFFVSLWKIFKKAGFSGFTSLIPIYNTYIVFKIIGHPSWNWSVLFPPVFAILWIVAQFKLAEKFGKGTGFGLGIFFFPYIFYPILAFGDAEYVKEEVPQIPQMPTN